MRWNILLFSHLEENTESLKTAGSKLQKYCEITSTYDADETIERYLNIQSEIVIICSDVPKTEILKVKKILHHMNGDIVIIENFDFQKYDVMEEIRKAIALFNTSNSDLFKTKFSHN